MVTQPSGRWAFAGALTASAAFVALVCRFFAPRWETNDDVAMSMIAHGYGLAATGSPNLVFSNVLWGHLVRALPSFGGTLGYSIASTGVLIGAGAALIYALRRFGVGPLACLALLVLVLLRPVLFQQFTLNAGLLAVGAIACLHLYARRNDWRALLLAGVLALASFLVRNLEFFLVMLVALPLLPWRALLARRAAPLAGLALMAAMAGATVIDHQAYQGDDWKPFMALNAVRVPFTDLGAGERLKQRPDVLARHGYSPNDITLLTTWYFADAKLADPQAMGRMLAELKGPGASPGEWPTTLLQGLQGLLRPNLWPLLLAAGLLALLRPDRRVAASWGLLLAIVMLLGLAGRPGVLRVYVPLVSLLVLAPLFVGGPVSAWRQRLRTGVLLGAALINTVGVFYHWNLFHLEAQQVRRELADFPHEPVVTWSGKFPFEAAYPVLNTPATSLAYRFYSLGTFTLAPFTVSFAEQRQGRGLTDRLLSESGVPIVASAEFFNYLDTYCRERHHGALRQLATQHHGRTELRWYRCERAAAAPTPAPQASHTQVPHRAGR